MKHIALITENSELEKICLEQVSAEPGVALRLGQSIEEAKVWALESSVHGILIDLKMFLRASGEQRDFINKLVDIIPVGKIRLVPGTSEITGTFGGDNLLGSEVFYFLLQKLKEIKTGRALRRFERIPRILSVLAEHPQWGEAPLRTNSVNLSKSGIFVIAAFPPPPGSFVELQLHELSQTLLFTIEVRWTLPWGKSDHHYPGFGGTFVDLKEEHLQALALF